MAVLLVGALYLNTVGNMDKEWESYEEVAAHLLNRVAEEFGLDRVEGKQKVRGGRSGTDWTIDAKGIREGEEGFVIIECRRYTTSKQKQKDMGALAYSILDAGAEGGIIVSSLGLQEGAQKVASAENIIEVRLSPDSTPKEYLMRFLNRVMIGLYEQMGMTEKVSITIHRADGNKSDQQG